MTAALKAARLPAMSDEQIKEAFLLEPDNHATTYQWFAAGVKAGQAAGQQGAAAAKRPAIWNDPTGAAESEMWDEGLGRYRRMTDAEHAANNKPGGA